MKNLFATILLILSVTTFTSGHIEDCSFANCADGQYWNDSAGCVACPPGYFCIGSVLQACTAGTYSISAGSTACDVCTEETYSLGATAVCHQCPAGYSCMNNAEPPIACVEGTYSPLGVKECLVCTVGHYCDGSGMQHTCPSGWYADVSGSKGCLQCPLGSECADATNGPVQCEAGMFSSHGQIQCQVCPQGTYSDKGAGLCSPCPAGFSCVGRTNNHVQCGRGFYSHAGSELCQQCEAGMYSTSGTSFCLPCPTGHTCNLPTLPPIPCGLGMYWSNSDAMARCISCPPGYRCSSHFHPPVACAVGEYSSPRSFTCQSCPAGKTCRDPALLPTDCPEGTYSLEGVALCLACPSGHSCNIEKILHTCPAGTYSMSGDAHCRLCPVGSMCPNPHQPPLPCQLGRTTQGLVNQTACTKCPAGYECPMPASSLTTCIAGWFSLGGNSLCKACPPGYKCPTSNKRPIICAAGEFSAGGEQICHTCPAGHSCLSRTQDLTTPCPQGSYSSLGEASCLTCPPGYSCDDFITPTECVAGEYSLRGQCHACPPGWECPATDGSVNTQCALGSYSSGGLTSCIMCPPGMECPNTVISTPTACKPGTFSIGSQIKCTVCPAGHECPLTTNSTVNSCSDGFYSSRGQWKCSECPAGFACPSKQYALLVPCQVGSYSLAGSAVCTECEAGKYCPSTTQLGLNCPLAYYSQLGASVCLQCPKGFACPLKNLLPVICPSGSFTDMPSMTCSPCAPGYICEAGSTSARPPSGRCSIGFYCPDGIVKTPCPAGTYGNKEGATSQEDGCVLCPPGFYCLASGIQPTQAQVCPPGHYCPIGTSSEFEYPCPGGTYNSLLGMQREQQCIICRVGYYCPAGDGTGDRLCMGGHYCPVGSPSPLACPAGTYTEERGLTTISDCMVCPAGFYCPTATESPIACPKGTYNPSLNQESSDDCRACLAGMVCPTTALVFPTENCAPGHYCPAGTSVPDAYPCEAGTYTDYHHLTSALECSICPRGYACPAGTGGLKAPEACKMGHWCPLGTRHGKQYTCPPGTWSNRTNLYQAQDCYLCPKGWFCLPGYAQPYGICGRGHYCPIGTHRRTQYPCPAGTWMWKELNERWEDCIKCTPGHYCPKGSSLPVPCAPGSYRTTVSAKSQSECTICAPGSYCPTEGITEQFPCSSGFYSSSNATECTPCKAGHYCMLGRTSEMQMIEDFICPAGMHCPTGLSHQPFFANNPCWQGHYCPKGDEHAYPQKCPNGTYNPFTNAKHVSDCLHCPEGYYCEPEGQIQPTAPCPPGHYCPRGTGYRFSHPCGIGFYRNSSAAITDNDCSECFAGKYCDAIGMPIPRDCPQGFYCPTGTILPEPCPKGYYSNITNVKRPTDCTPCEPGLYCAEVGMREPTGECDPGYLCKGGSFLSAPRGGITGGLCPKGGYCPRGTKKPEACPIGYFNQQEGGISPDNCTACPHGFYCAGTSEPEPTGPCNPGFYCDGGATSPNQHATPAGHYSRAHASTPVPCARGEYQSSTAMPSCDACSKGSYCNRTGLSVPDICTPGHYCPDGTKDPFPCPTGTYNNIMGRMNVSDCRLCTPGMYCGATALTEPTGYCFAGYYCKHGSPVPNPGNYSEDAVKLSYGGVCPTGHFCMVGTIEPNHQPCPKGTYNPSRGAEDVSRCLPCPGGKHCSTTGLSEPTGDCSGGYYCIAGSTTSTPLDKVQGDSCPEGFHCPLGSRAPVECAPGTFGNVTQLAACHACPERHYCNNGHFPVVCPLGFYCPAGSYFETKEPCPPGTYAASEGLATIEECTPCPPGKYCDGYALTKDLMGLCEPGYYCAIGVNTSRPSQNLTTGQGGVCPAGYYCAEGTSDYHTTPCLQGTYSSVEGLRDATECQLCDSGMYCSGTGLAKPTGECFAGFYCKREVSIPNNPMHDGKSGPCHPGHFCPKGTSFPLGCPPGTYMPLTGAAECWSCPPRFYCPANQTDYSSYPCITGHYCPRGTAYSTQYPCPPGTYRNLKLGEAGSDCFVCPSGQYCQDAGLSSPSGPCQGGYYCTGGAASSQPALDIFDPLYFMEGSNYTVKDFISVSQCLANSTGGICPPGYYCPQGSLTPQKCPAGFFCYGYGNANTTGLCEAGHYCTGEASQPRPVDGFSGNVCPQAHYCPAGSFEATPCPPGTYSAEIGNKKLEDCHLCDAGKYCTSEAQTSITGTCLAGFYCPPGQWQPNPPAYPCSPGHYCLEGAPTQTLCPEGTWTDLYLQTLCKTCVKGFYCDRADALVTPIADFTLYPCPAGFYCPSGTKYAKEYGCPPGTYSSDLKLKAPEQCTQCPPGKYCLGSSASLSGDCAGGYHCSGGVSTPTPEGALCPAGHFCPSGTPSPVACPEGSFSNVTGLERSEQCQNCTCGMYCAGPGLEQPIGLCTERYFCQQSAIRAVPQDPLTGGECTPGHYCPQGSCAPLPCEDGTYTTESLSKECAVCPMGSYCVGDHVTPDPCPPGFYCPQGTGYNWKLCPPGTFNDKYGLINISSCQPCKGGMYCTHFNATFPSGYCSAGYYCSSGSDGSQPDGHSNTGNAGPCPAGHFCPVNTSVPLPCPKGSFSNRTHLKSSGECSVCTPGTYCGSEGLTTPSGQCDVGFFCHTGSLVANPYLVTENGGPCPIGHYCPAGTSHPLPCSRGAYNNRTGQRECVQCCKGFLCDEASISCVTTCSKGHYCPAGSEQATPCRAGTYNNATGMQRESDCTPCDAGWYCPHSGMSVPHDRCAQGWYCTLGALSSMPADNFTTSCGNHYYTGGECLPGQYCPKGTHQPLPCTAGSYCSTKGQGQVTGPCIEGYYCTGGARLNNPTDGITGDICPPGHFCPGGSKSPTMCPPGTYTGVLGNKQPSDCQPCQPGKFCEDWASTAPTANCSQGYYCPLGQNASNPEQFRCTPGHYCVSGSTVPQACEAGTYQDAFYAATCKVCPEGRYCNALVLNDSRCAYGVQTPATCPHGYYCPVGMKTGKEHGCPKGTYSGDGGLANSTQCTSCPTGKFCATKGLSLWNGECAAGYYCIVGATTATPDDKGVTGYPCPKGHYCPEGTNTTLACPPGTYNPSEGLGAPHQCLSCLPGRYCAQYAMNETSGPCDEGFYCVGNSLTARPTDEITGDVCPSGSYCEKGTGVPEPCPPGSYMNETQAASCYQCPPGFYCIDRVSPVTCPPGFYCPPGTGHNHQPCPTGTYSNSSGLSNVFQCTSCPRGRYCMSINSTASSGFCHAGFYCHNGSDTPAPSDAGTVGVCPVGHYCPSGDVRAPIPCPVGTFNNQTHGESLKDCAPCSPGFHCSDVGISSPTNHCDSGYYCTSGAPVSNPQLNTTTDFGPCPPGHYCLRGTALPIKCPAGSFNPLTRQSECTSCPAGFYCEEGSSEFFPCPEGFFCPNSTAGPYGHACAKGTFKNFTRGSSVEDCLQCPPGWYCATGGLSQPTGLCRGGWFCNGGSWSATPIAANSTNNETWMCPNLNTGGMCKRGEFCPPGSSRATPCTVGHFCGEERLATPSGLCAAGFFCNGGSSERAPYNQLYGGVCPSGHYCPEGSDRPTACPIGHFAPGKANNMSDACLLCPGGQYCPHEGLSAPAGYCSKGYYCPSGQHHPNPVDKKCQPGHFCPEGSQEHLACPPGSYQPNTGMASCIDCPAGYYCSLTNTTSLVNPVVCPPGFFCPNGTSTYLKYPCEPGYFGNSSGLSHLDQCQPCTPGYYCDKQAMIEPANKCQAGFYCVLKATTPQPADASQGGGYCEKGYYCEAGSHSQTPCPAGTYSDQTHLQDKTDCVPCDGGMYCDAPAITHPTGSCLKGFYCSGKSIEQAPVNETYGDICPPGHYCLERTTIPTPCPPGTFNNQSAGNDLSHCMSCTAGHYCSGYGNREPDGECSVGHFCTLAAFTLTPVASSVNNSVVCPTMQQVGGRCLKGTYCPPGSHLPTPCDKGKYCADDTLGTPSGDCAAGYYCDFNSMRADPQECQSGHYCPKGTAVEVKCPQGSYNPFTRQTSKQDCTNCTAGFFCPYAGMSETPFRCAQGFYCPEGSWQNYTVICPRGHYCLTGSGQPTPCPAGEYQDEEGEHYCKTCPAGFYCDPTFAGVPGVSLPQPCIKGYYCPTNTSSVHQDPCPPGTYSNRLGLVQVSECTPCDEGHYCDGWGQTNATEECHAGWYCIGGSSTPRPEDGITGNRCNSGTYCLQGSSQGLPCPVGTFNNRTGLQDATTCKPCSAGWYCPSEGLSQPYQRCQEGYWCISGSPTPTPDNAVYGRKCPVGSYCPEGVSSPLRCPPGTYQPLEQRSHEGQCLSCIPGYYCGAAGSANVTGPCDKGYYCNGNTSVSNPESGWCPVGYYCKEATVYPVPCADGTFQSKQGQEECLICPAGRKCTRGFSAVDRCTAGYYCPEGTGYDQQPCPVGTFSSQRHLSRADHCMTCTAGHYCEETGISEPTGGCDPGYWCLEGVSKSRPANSSSAGVGGLCFLGHQCPGSTSYPEPCQPGFYADVTGLSACKVCPQGYYCKPASVQPTVCPTGHYCPAGGHDPRRCLPGTFNSDVGSRNSSVCQPCPPGKFCEGFANPQPTGDCTAGYYCKLGAVSSTPGNEFGFLIESNDTSCRQVYDCVCPALNKTTGDICPPGHYCPTGSQRPTVCPPGQYCLLPGLTEPTGDCEEGFYCSDGSTSSTQYQCWAGHYCVRASTLPKRCPMGTFSAATNNRRLEDCEICLPGRYCDRAGLNQTSGPCAAKFYCPPGQSTSKPFQCTPGHYCPEGSSYPIPCQNGTYQNTSAQDECILCPPGYYCDPAQGAVVSPRLCPVGHYCPLGTSYRKSFPCPPSTFGPNTGNGALSQCLPCTPGMYCASDGLSSPTGNCSERFYCAGGSISAEPYKQVPVTLWTFAYQNDLCPRGYYCGNFTSTPKPCPAGYYSNVRGLRRYDDCQACPPGKFCQEIGAREIKDPLDCGPGFVCRQASYTPTPLNISRNIGYICPKGYYCPQGSSIEQSCYPGTYQANEGQASCTPCDPSYMCEGYNIHLPQPCQPGFYCPGGSAQMCPPGTFSNRTSLVSASQCDACPAGLYCAEYGLTIPTGVCLETYFCEGGASGPAPNDTSLDFPRNGPCPTGNFCPEGTQEPIRCPVGAFRNQTGGGNSSDCFECTPGHYCETDGLSQPTGPCALGWYCPAGQIQAQSNNYTCFAGHYCPLGTAYPVECERGTYQPYYAQGSCIDCPAGYYCSNRVSELVECPARYYCPVRTEIPLICPNGTYSLLNDTGMEGAHQCRSCVSAHYCHLGRIIGLCSGGYSCQSGSPSPTPRETLIGPSTQAGPCPPGFYCPYGVEMPVPCPESTFKDYAGGYGNVSDCLTCPAGQQCFEGDLRVHYCPHGYYCPATVPDPVPCPVHTYRDAVGAKYLTDCFPCAAGFHCDFVGMATHADSPCPIGHYCLEGQPPAKCLPGTHRLEVQGATPESCGPCPPKFFCPANSTEPAGFPCTPSHYCKLGSAMENECPAGYYCPAMTENPVVCPGGYYCVNGSAVPRICEYPYFCPAGSSKPQICPLGHKAIAVSGNRTSVADSCLVCPAGFYGNEVLRLNCTQCPAKYICPTGTKDPNQFECPKGFYCPPGSPEGVPCAAGMYGNRTKAGVATDCHDCPANTFNHEKGREACRPCGSSAWAGRGWANCRCTGSHRSFQISDGSCECESGYVYYDDVEVERREGNSDKSCQPQVTERCGWGEVRLASTLECIDPDTLPANYCDESCDSAGGYVRDGRCVCRNYAVLNSVCNATCLERSPAVVVQRNQHTRKLHLKLLNHTTGATVDDRALPNEFGINDFDILPHVAEVVDFTTDGSYGRVLTNTQDVEQLLTRQTGARRKKRSTQSNSLPGVRSPLVCVQINQAVFFVLALNSTHRNQSHYPRYAKNHLFNTNARFDYGQFRQLRMLVENTDYSLHTFANVFTEKGVYVFYDNARPQRETIVLVPKHGAKCPQRMEAASPVFMAQFGVGGNSAVPLNEAPNWILIWVLVGLMVLFIVTLVVLAIMIRPRNLGIYPVEELRPRYKGLGAPVPELPLVPAEEREPSPATHRNCTSVGSLENLNVRTLYDKLEDQSLHVTSQMARHKQDTAAFYATITQQTEGLKAMLENLDVSKITRGAEEADDDLKASTCGGDLKKTLALLLDQYANRLQPSSTPVYSQGQRVVNEPQQQHPTTQQHQLQQPTTQQHQLQQQQPTKLSVIHNLCSDRIQVENSLQENEWTKLQDFHHDKANEIRALKQEISEELDADLSDEEIQKIISHHERMEKKLLEQKARGKLLLLQTLQENRKEKLNGVNSKHQQFVQQADVNVDDDLSSPTDTVELKSATIELCAAEETKSLAKKECRQTERNDKEHERAAVKSFTNEIKSLVKKGTLVEAECDTLLSEEQSTVDRLREDCERTKTNEMLSFNEKLDQRKFSSMQQLLHQHELENKEVPDSEWLREKQELEIELLNTSFESERQQNFAELIKKLSMEYQNAVRESHKKFVEKISMDEETKQAIIENLDKTSKNVVNECKLKNKASLEHLQANLEAEKRNRVEELKRRTLEEAHHVIMSQQKTMIAENATQDDIQLSDVSSTKQNNEEIALRNEQERTIEELREKHEGEKEKLERNLDREDRQRLQNEAKAFEVTKTQRLRELQNRHEAEMNSRPKITANERRELESANRLEMETLVRQLEEGRDAEARALQQNLEQQRKVKEDALQRKHDTAMAREVSEQKREAADTANKLVKEAEKERMLDAIKENSDQSIEQIIKKVLGERHGKEIEELERSFSDSKKIELDDLLLRLEEEHAKEKEKLVKKHENELKNIKSDGLDADETRQHRMQTINRHQLELSNLTQKFEEELKQRKKKAQADLQLKHANQQLVMKERHYKEFADYLHDLSPQDLKSVEDAKEAARQVQLAREKIEQEKRENEEKLQWEMKEFEASEKERMEREILEYEAEIEREAQEEMNKSEKLMLELAQQREQLVKEKKLKSKEEIKKLAERGVSAAEQEAVLQEHSKDIAKIVSKLDTDRMRMKSGLQAKLQKKKEERRFAKLKDLEKQSAEVQEELREKVENEEQQLNNEVVAQLKQVLSVPSLADVVTQPAAAVGVENNIPDKQESFPASFVNAIPLSTADTFDLLMQSPLYDKLLTIRSHVQDKPSLEEPHQQDDNTAAIPVDSSDPDLKPVDLASLSARDFVVYKFGCFVRDMLTVQCHFSPVHVLVADRLPHNPSLTHNQYQGSFAYDSNNRIVYVLRARLANAGEFVFMLVHTLAHVHAGDMRDDRDPRFTREFHRALTQLCSDLFVSRYRTKSSVVVPNATAAKENKEENVTELKASQCENLLEEIFRKAQQNDDREKALDDLLEARLARDTLADDVIEKRFARYLEYLRGSKLNHLLATLEERRSNVQLDGTHTHVENKLKEESTAINHMHAIVGDNLRHSYLARTSVKLPFVRRGEPDGAADDIYEMFLRSQIELLYEKADALDADFARYTRQEIKSARDVRQLEGDANAHLVMLRNLTDEDPSHVHLTRVVKDSNNQVIAQRAKLEQARRSKKELLARMTRIKEETDSKQEMLQKYLNEQQEKDSVL